jgi:hypothetical protein
MDLLGRVRAIMSAPTSEWLVIGREAGALSNLMLRYVAILALIPAVARLLGASVVGSYAPISSSLLGAIAIYLASLAIVGLLALVIDALAPAFGAHRNFRGALKLAAYSCTPVWLAGVFLILPGLSFLILIGLYGGFLLRAGLPARMKAPADKTFGYAAAAVGTALVLTIGVSSVAAPLFAAP